MTQDMQTDNTEVALLQLWAAGDHFVVNLKEIDPDDVMKCEQRQLVVSIEEGIALMTAMTSLMHSLNGIKQSSRP